MQLETRGKRAASAGGLNQDRGHSSEPGHWGMISSLNAGNRKRLPIHSALSLAAWPDLDLFNLANVSWQDFLPAALAL